MSLALAALLTSVASSNAATMLVGNVSNGPGDTLWALNNNTLMTGGIAVMGYFGPGVTESQINTIAGLVANLGSFVSVSTVGVGTSIGATLGAAAAGYAEDSNSSGTSVPGGLILAGNPLIGRTVYQIVTNAATLAGATASNQFYLGSFGTFLGDQPVEQAFAGNPAGRPAIISDGLGTFTGDPGGGAGSGGYVTLKLAVVPEPSAAVLGALGALGLLRRRRI